MPLCFFCFSVVEFWFLLNVLAALWFLRVWTSAFVECLFNLFVVPSCEHVPKNKFHSDRELAFSVRVVHSNLSCIQQVYRTEEDSILTESLFALCGFYRATEIAPTHNKSANQSTANKQAKASEYC